MNKITSQEALNLSYQETKDYLTSEKNLLFLLQPTNSSYINLISVIENLNTLGHFNKYIGYTAKQNFQVLRSDYITDLKNGEYFLQAKSDTLDFIRRALRTLISPENIM